MENKEEAMSYSASRKKEYKERGGLQKQRINIIMYSY